MVITSFILRSFFTGFFAACLVGPVFILVLYRSLTGGLKSGIVSALGTALADGIYFFIAAFGSIGGLSWIQNLKAFETVGGPLMITFGLWTLLRRNTPHSEAATVFGPALIWQALSTMLLTFSNPLTLIFFGSIANYVFPELQYLSFSQVFLASIFLSLGSLTLLLSTMFFTRWQQKITPESLVYFFKTFSGTTLLLTGCFLTLKYWAPSPQLFRPVKQFSLVKKH